MSQAQPANESHLQPAPLVMALLAEPIVLEAEALERYLKEQAPDENIQIQSGEQGESHSLIILWRKTAFAVMAIDKPIPTETFTTALRTSYGLKDGEQMTAGHRAHLIMTPLQLAQHHGQAIIHSIMLVELSNMLANYGKALGFYWSNSETLADPAQFSQAVDGVKAAMAQQARGERDAGNQLPITLWVGIRLFSPDQKTNFGALTKGLNAFLGYELEIKPVQWKPGDIAERVYGTVAYLFSNGPVLQSGQTLGVNDKEHFRISQEPATESLPQRLVLELESV